MVLFSRLRQSIVFLTCPLVRILLQEVFQFCIVRVVRNVDKQAAGRQQVRKLATQNESHRGTVKFPCHQILLSFDIVSRNHLSFSPTWLSGVSSVESIDYLTLLKEVPQQFLPFALAQPGHEHSKSRRPSTQLSILVQSHSPIWPVAAKYCGR